MTTADLWVVLGLLTASFGFLACALALIAALNWAFTRAWTAGANAAARHIETCMTRALEIPLYGTPKSHEIDDEYRRLIETHHE